MHARRSLQWLAKATSEVEWRVRQARSQEGWGWLFKNALLEGYFRDRAIERCVEDHWPRTFLRCYVASDDPWACARRQLPQEACLRLEDALTIVDHDPGGRCGEPRSRFF